MHENMKTVGEYEYDEKNEIGRGAFGKVYMGHKRTTLGGVAAIKEVDVNNYNLKQLPDSINREMQILKTLSNPKHDNIVTLFHCEQQDQFVYFVMEFCYGGNLREYLQSEKKLNEITIRIFLKQIAAGLKAAHDMNIIHRDLKPENILLTFSGFRYPSPNNITLKIADFGIGRILEANEMAITNCGTPFYMAPEVYLQRPGGYKFKPDLWSVGVIAYECHVGSLPEKSLMALHDVEIPSTNNPDFANLLNGLLEKDEKKRFDTEQFMNHQFLAVNVAYEYLNLKNPEIDGNWVTLMPEIFDEMSIILSGSWLKEREDVNQTIQVEVKKIARKFDLKIDIKMSCCDGANTISLSGDPCRIELAITDLNKIQPFSMNCSPTVQKGINDLQPDAAGMPCTRNTELGQSTNVENMQSINKHGRLAWKSDDTLLLNDAKSGSESEKSSEPVDLNQGKKRVGTLRVGDETKSESSGVEESTANGAGVTAQQKEGIRKRVFLLKPSENQPKSPNDAFGSPTPVSYPASNLYQTVISIHMDIHQYLLEHSMVLDFTDSSVVQFLVSGQHIDWTIGNNNQTDLRGDEKDLRRLIGKLHIKCYSAPDELDFDTFREVIETDNNNSNVTLIFNPKERSCKVVGPMDNVKRTYEWIRGISDELSKRSTQKSNKGDNSRWSDKGSSEHQQSQTHWRSPDRKSDMLRKHSSFSDRKQKMTKPGDGFVISRSSKDRLELTTPGNLRVSVYQGNMIKQGTEVIVNPANEHLAHGGGLARVILNAGGPVIDQESRDIISKQGKVQTSEVVHTSAGNLPPPIKYVLHAVGPTAYEFKDNKAGLVSTLKVTFRNCLEYANDKLGVSSISLPPISSGIFAVPMPDIIQGVVEAIQYFDGRNPSAVLKEVHFISNDAATTEEMIKCFLNVIEGVMPKDNQKRQVQCTDMFTSKDSEHRDNLKEAAESKDASGLRGNKTYDSELDRICALSVLPNIYVEEDKFNYLNRCHNHELSRIFQKCSVFELYKDVEGHKLAIQTNGNYSTDSVMAEFRKLYSKTTKNFNSTNVDIPEGVDPESLKSLVEPMTESRDVALRLIRQQRALTCRIVGPAREIERARKELNDVIAYYRLYGHGFDNKANKMADQITITLTQNDQKRNVQLYSAVAASNVNQPIFTILTKSHDSLMLSALNLLTIEVKRDDLTSIQDVDVVVSCITHLLDVASPLANKIIGAAGSNVRMELAAIKYQFSFLHTGYLVHTSTGNLKRLKRIIHVVPPELSEFPYGEVRTRDALRCVFINCFRRTNDDLMMKSICLPPIGFTSNGAEMVVDCFLDAVKMFAEAVANSSASTQHQPHPHHLSLIQLVANDQHCIDKLLQCIKRRL